MLKQTKNDDLKLFINLSKEPEVKDVNDVKIHVVIAAL
jgi:flagellar biosynthesis protein FliP